MGSFHVPGLVVARACGICDSAFVLADHVRVSFRVARDSEVKWITAPKPHSGRAAIFVYCTAPIPKDFWISNSMLGRRLENHSSGADGIEHVSEISQVSDRGVCREDR